MFPIASIVNTTPASNITFSNIPQNFAHLQLRVFSRINAPGNSNWYGDFCTLNGDATSANYNINGWNTYAVNGAGAQSGTASFYSGSQMVINNVLMDNAVSQNFHTNTIVDFLDYSNTGKYKTMNSIYGFVCNFAPNNMGQIMGVWNSTSAITNIKISNPINNWTAATRFDLYGITTSNVGSY